MGEGDFYIYATEFILKTLNFSTTKENCSPKSSTERVNVKESTKIETIDFQ